MVAAATALVLVGGSVVPFLNPIYVRFEQDMTDAGAWTGYSPAQLDQVTGALLADLVLWQGTFDITLDGAPVLKQPEIEHMLDVRGVFTGFFALCLTALAGLIVAFRRARGSEQRAAAWRSVAAGAKVLGVVIALAGAFTVLAFDAAFEVFHQLFFTRGSYTFDPRTDKLVQLFPVAFWSQTAMIVGVVILGACLVTWYAATRRAATLATRVPG